MATTFVQLKVTTNANAFETDATEALTFDSNATVGNFVVVGIGLTATNRTISSVTDSGGNTYALLSEGGVNATVDSGGSATEVWLYGAPVTSAANIVTVVINSALATPARMWILEVSGQHATTPIEDVAVTTTTSATSHPSGSVTTAAAGNIVIGMLFGTNGTYTNQATWTQIDNSANGISAYKAVDAATTTWTPTTGGSESTAIVTIAIQPAAAGVSVPVILHHLKQQGIC
jgi:hypothetical protein